MANRVHLSALWKKITLSRVQTLHQAKLSDFRSFGNGRQTATKSLCCGFRVFIISSERQWAITQAALSDRYPKQWLLEGSRRCVVNSSP